MSVAGADGVSDTLDPWGKSFPPLNATTKAKAVPRNIPDAWDDEEEEEDSEKIWESANSKAPMPELLISRSSTGPPSIVSPPTAAIQAPLRILKRPSSNSNSSSTVSSMTSASALAKNLAEREASYQAARERIFGEVELKKPSTPPTPSQTLPSAASTVIRNPRGPDDATQQEKPKGFSSKRGRHNKSQRGEVK